ncbi:MAG TPA: NADH-quinone oxidoreductase subunit NuoH [Anaerolineae bacterium]|nr:NADH-quinone oxidoreductase subunit NuoH [Caldilineae bacterium]HID35733.1 NADH-quinone oxidoreductase subunit NuoH [Anaerolineae bacterium]
MDLRAIGESFIAWLQGLGLPEGWVLLINWLLGALIILGIALLLALALIWLERKLAGRIQDRLGPNRVGPFGLIQPIADALKLLTKEDITPADADRITFNLAPVIAVFHVLMLFVVIPFADEVVGANINVGVLYLMAFGALGAMAMLMAGWASRNKYALLGGFRVVAQLFSYEIPIALVMMIPVLLVGSMNLNDIVRGQGSLFGLGWFVWVLPAAFALYFVAALAEGERAPFDLLEAESEIVAGYNIEYSAMKFAWFYLAFFLNTWILSAVATTLFLGGWQGPFVDQIPALGVVYFFAKTLFMFFLFAWVRATFPRLRIDQMMAFCWKVLVPMGLALLLGSAIIAKMGAEMALPNLVTGSLLLILNVVILLVTLSLLGRYTRTLQATQNKRLFTPELPRL